jgi:hypothetical protein
MEGALRDCEDRCQSRASGPTISTAIVVTRVVDCCECTVVRVPELYASRQRRLDTVAKPHVGQTGTEAAIRAVILI